MNPAKGAECQDCGVSRHFGCDTGRLAHVLHSVETGTDAMQITDQQVKLAQEQILAKKKLVKELMEIGLANQAAADQQMVKELVEKVIAMPDREDRIADLKARIEAGTYHVTADQIVDAMARRAIADKMV